MVSDFLGSYFQVDMSKVNLETLKPWVTSKITEYLHFEDDVVVEFIFNQLEERVRGCPHFACSVERLIFFFFFFFFAAVISG